MSSIAKRRVTAEEYLLRERESEWKHEFFDGYLIAMAGGTRSHNVLAANVARIIGNQVVPRGCQVLSSDQRIGLPRKGAGYFYPDVSVVCGEPETEDHREDIVLNPVLIVEVLSPSTAAYDREEKFQKYRTIPSLKVFVLISQHRPFVEVHERKDFNRWETTYAESIDANIDLPVVNASMKLQDIYTFVEFKSPAEPTSLSRDESIHDPGPT